MSDRNPKAQTSFHVIVLVLGTLTAFGPLSIDMYLASLPKIASDFSVPLSSVQLSLTSFFIGLALGQVFYGPVSDRYGRKKPLYFGLGLYALASLGCGFAQSSDQLILLRFFQALGSCGGMVASRAVVRDLFDERESAKVFSLLLLIMGVAPIVAPLLGGYINASLGWRYIFYILTILSLFSMAAIFWFLPETRKPSPEVLLTRSLFTFRDILKNPQFVRYAIAGGAAQAGMFAYITGSPFVFIEFFGVPSEKYGWYFGANALGLIAVSQTNVRLLERYSPESILRFSFFVLLIASGSLLLASLLGASFPLTAFFLFVYLAFLGVTFPNTTALALGSEGARAGSASALLGTLQFTLAATASAAVSFFHTGTAVTMASIIFVCALIAFSLGQFKNS